MPIIQAFPQAPTGAELARLFLAGAEQSAQRQRDQVNQALSAARLAATIDDIQGRRDDRKTARQDKLDEKKRREDADRAGSEAMLSEMQRLAGTVPPPGGYPDPAFRGPPSPDQVSSGLDPATVSAFRGSTPETQRAILSSYRGTVDDLIRRQATQNHELKKQAAVKFLMDQLGGVDENGVPVSKAGQRLLNDLKMQEAGFAGGKVTYDNLVAGDDPSQTKPIDLLRQMRIATAEIDQRIAGIEAMRNPITRMFTSVNIGGKTFAPEDLQTELVRLRNQKALVLEQFLSQANLPPGVMENTVIGPSMFSPAQPPAVMPQAPAAAPIAPSVGAGSGGGSESQGYQSDSAAEIQRLLELKRKTLGKMKP